MATRRAWCLVAVFTLSGASSALAQGISLGYQSQSWSPDELRRFHGGMARLDLGSVAELSFELGIARWGDEGSTCSGLILDPSGCEPQSLSVGSETMGISLGFTGSRLSVSGGELSIVPWAGIAGTTLHTEGRTNGARNFDSFAHFVVGLAGRYRSRPLWRGRVGFFAELRGFAGKAISSGICADCYDPLHGDAAGNSVLVGVTIGR